MRLDRDVALKILAPHLSADPQFRQRFEREARVVASLSHPHVCAIYDIGSVPDGNVAIHYLVMEYLEGETLAARLRRGKPPIEELRAWAVAIADALEMAHARGLVHRDVKKANLFITSAGAVKVEIPIEDSRGWSRRWPNTIRSSPSRSGGRTYDTRATRASSRSGVACSAPDGRISQPPPSVRFAPCR